MIVNQRCKVTQLIAKASHRWVTDVIDKRMPRSSNDNFLTLRLRIRVASDTPGKPAIMASPREYHSSISLHRQRLTVVLEQLRTPLTDLLRINHPILLAGMNVAAGPKLAAAVTNAGGLGVIGGVGYTPDMLREQIAELKGFLKDKNAPFGVDLLIPQVGGNARKTKYVSLFPFAFREC